MFTIHLARVLAALVLPVMSTITASANESATTDWALLGNSSEMQHHSELDEINTGTVSELGLVWSVDLPAADGLIGNPLIQDGRIFQSGARSQVFANDLRTGKLLWTYEPRSDASAGGPLEATFQRLNRGVALHDDLVIVATADCALVAIDQSSGEKRWEAQACDPSDQYSITGAPRVGGGMVFIGNTGADLGTNRGHVNAFDARTGRHLWRFYTVPGDPEKPQEGELYEMAAATWGQGKTPSGGNPWEGITYDAKLSQLYIGTGGAIPLDPSKRGEGAGDELFTSSIVALDAKTGAYRWHFKQVPGDGWNYEPTGIMVATLPVGPGGAERRVVFSVGKDGFVYVLDAKTGAFISGRNYVQVNWAKGLDESTGRPIYDPAARWWERPDGAVVLPNSLGAHSFEAMAFDPKQKLLFIPASTYPELKRLEAADAGTEVGYSYDWYYGSKGHPGWESFGEVVAWDPVTHTAMWRQRHDVPLNGGVLHTNGGLVFQGSADGFFSAYDSATGKKLWAAPAGGAIRGAASTVMVDGRQFIIVPSGNGSTSVTAAQLTRYASVPRSRSKPRLLAYALGGSAAAPHWAEVVSIPKPDAPRFPAEMASAGSSVFLGCASCHGYDAESLQGSAPDLRLRLSPSLEYLKAILNGALAARGMPAFDLSDEDVQALYAYLVNTAWDAYEANAGLSATGGSPDEATKEPTMNNREFLIALDDLSRDDMEENPPLEAKAVGNPRRILSGHDSKGWSKVFFGGDILSFVVDLEPAKFEIEDVGYDEFIHVLDGTLILTDKEGNAQRFEAGEFLVMPKGFSGTWEALGNYRELVVIEAKTFAEEMSKP